MQLSSLRSLLGNTIELHVVPAIASGRGGGGGMYVHVRASVWCKHIALSHKYTVVQVLLFVGCCLATESLNLNNTKWKGWR